MGKRHNTLSDEIFKNSKYIYTLEQALGIDDFKKECKNNKEYKGQYDMMLEVFKTLITINNVLFSDSNKNIKEKQDEIYDILFKIVYKNEDSERLKYGLRLQKELKDSHTRYLYKKFIDWYNNFYTYSFDTMKKQIEEEMTRLENVDFDKVVKGGIQYEKNKNSNYKIYISKLDFLYSNNDEIKENYKNEFYDIYGIVLDRKQLNNICYIYKIVACANNGIVKLLFNDKSKDFELSIKNNIEDYFKAYLTTINIDIKSNKTYMKQASKFYKEYYNLQALPQLLQDDKKAKEIFDNVDIDQLINNYDLYYFYLNVLKIIKEKHILSIKTDIIVKMINDLKEIYNLMYDNVPTITNESQVELAYDKIQKIIDRNKEMFERLS